MYMIDVNKTVYTYGEGFLGCLGHGSFQHIESAKPLESLKTEKLKCISAGWYIIFECFIVIFSYSMCLKDIPLLCMCFEI